MKTFKTESGDEYEVSNEKYLFPMLNFTSKGTNYWEPAPVENNLSDRYIGRVILQIHQILGIFQSLNIDLDKKKFLDVGTGNALIPQLLLKYSNITSAVGIDPYTENTDMSSWQPENTSENLNQLFNFIDKKISGKFEFEKYKNILSSESFSLKPPLVNINLQTKKKKFRKVRLGAHEMAVLKDTFDVIYCKAIEHIQNWDLVFDQISKVSKIGTIVYFKHRSFFSYLGPHRFSSTGIPWGHLLLTDDDYKNYTKQFHNSRSEEMIRFFFKNLTYPRKSLSSMTRIASKHSMYPLTTIIEKPKYYQKLLGSIKNIDGFWENIKKNYPDVSAEEVLSGICHLVFIKV